MGEIAIGDEDEWVGAGCFLCGCSSGGFALRAAGRLRECPYNPDAKCTSMSRIVICVIAFHAAVI